MDLFIGALLNIIFYVIVIKKVFKLKWIDKPFRNISIIILTSITIAMINMFNTDIFKILITIPFVTLAIKVIFELKLEKSLLLVLISTGYMFIGEIVAFTLISIFKIDYTKLSDYVFGGSIGAVLTIASTIPVLLFKPLNEFIRKNLKVLERNQIYIMWLFLATIIITLSYRNMISIGNMGAVVINLVLVLVFVIIVYLLYKESIKSNKLSENYNILLNYLEQYEKEIEEKRKIVHDFKNQLIVINGYADPSNTKLKEYISEIIKENRVIRDNYLVKNIDKIPSGLKGLIYYKFSQLDKSMNIDLLIKKKIKEFDDLNSKVNKDVIKIVGILLDNAIESARASNDKYISLEMKKEDNKILIIIENSTDKKVDTSKIMGTGFSTKGKNRGYGLSIVNDIIKSNDKIEFTINSYGSMFETILKIKL
mgnify:FL=1